VINVVNRSKTDNRNYKDITDKSPDGKKYKYTDSHKDPFTGLKVRYRLNAKQWRRDRPRWFRELMEIRHDDIQHTKTDT